MIKQSTLFALFADAAFAGAPGAESTDPAKNAVRASCYMSFSIGAALRTCDTNFGSAGKSAIIMSINAWCMTDQESSVRLVQFGVSNPGGEPATVYEAGFQTVTIVYNSVEQSLTAGGLFSVVQPANSTTPPKLSAFMKRLSGSGITNCHIHYAGQIVP